VREREREERREEGLATRSVGTEPIPLLFRNSVAPRLADADADADVEYRYII